MSSAMCSKQTLHLLAIFSLTHKIAFRMLSDAIEAFIRLKMTLSRCRLVAVVVVFFFISVCFKSTEMPFTHKLAPLSVTLCPYSPYCVVRIISRFRIGSLVGKTSNSSITTELTFLFESADSALTALIIFPWSAKERTREWKKMRNKWEIHVRFIAKCQKNEIKMDGKESQTTKSHRDNTSFFASIPLGAMEIRWFCTFASYTYTYTHKNNCVRILATTASALLIGILSNAHFFLCPVLSIGRASAHVFAYDSVFDVFLIFVQQQQKSLGRKKKIPLSQEAIRTLCHKSIYHFVNPSSRTLYRYRSLIHFFFQFHLHVAR